MQWKPKTFWEVCFILCVLVLSIHEICKKGSLVWKFPCTSVGSKVLEIWVTLSRHSLHGDKIYFFRYMATSFLAPSYARKIFPCLDEPVFKAEFDIFLVRKVSKVSISNMPVSLTESRYGLFSPVHDAGEMYN